MGVFDSVKDLYYSLEEKYYSLLDKVDEKIPVYKIIDPIDKVVPTFALFLGLLVLLLVAGGMYFFGFAGQSTTLLLIVKDEQGNFLDGADIKIIVDGAEENYATDAQGEISIPGFARDSVLQLEVSKTDYQTRLIDITITDFPTQIQEVVLQTAELDFISKTIRVVDDSGAGVREDLTLHFSCSSPYAPTISSIDLSASDNGEAVVMVPTNCERLIVSVDDGILFDSVDSQEFSVDESDGVIILDEAIISDASILVSLKNEDGDLVNDSVQVKLFRFENSLANPLVGPIDLEVTDSGTTSFSVSPGQYVVKTSSTPLYAQQESGTITLTSGESESVELLLEENTIQGEITVRIIDSVSRQSIDNVSVTLKEMASQNIVEIRTTDSQDDGVVTFNVSRQIEYEVIAEASGYELGKRVGLTISSAVVEIELDPCTPSTCGSLKAKVVDQDGEEIENATVALYDADTGFLAGFLNRTTDVNGYAIFDAVPSGSYFVFAFKETTEGRSDTKFFTSSLDDTDEEDYVVTINVPNGNVKAIVVDKEKQPIPFAVVSVFDARNNQLIGSSFTNAEGVYELETKANKRVYLKVSQKSTTPKYADYYTIEKPVVGESTQEFLAILEPEIIGKNVEVEFLGLFKEDAVATVLSVGEEYVAKFKLRLPEQKSYSQSGMHIRTGTETIMEKDPLFLKKINAPMTSVIRATRFDESSGLSEQNYLLTNSDAKWVNLVWTNPHAGVYEVEAQIQVKGTASIQEQLKLFWRAWAQNGIRERHPVDDTVSVELYSETFSRFYEVGVTTLCDDRFCFSARIRDLTEGLTQSVVESYNAENLQEYELRFTILNNSETRIHNSANLRVNNPEENLLFTDYSVTDAQTRETEGILNASEFPRFDVGTLSPKNKIEFYTKFVTQLNGSATVNVRLISDESIVFEKNIVINIAAPKKLEALIQPSFFASGIETDVNVLVLDAQTQIEVEGAVLRLKDKRDNVIQTALTGRDGYAYFTIPAQKPGNVLLLEIEKPQYATLVKEIKINGDLVELSPKSLAFALNAKTKFEDTQNLSVANVTHLPLVIKKINLKGDFESLIDQKASQDFLDLSYTDFQIDGQDTKDLEVKIILSEEGKSISERQDLEGELNIVFENFGKQWVYTVPVKVVIGLEGEVDDPNCLSISRSEWVSTTEGEPARTEVVISNNCIINGQPIELRSLQARVEWESNELGVFDVTIGENKTDLRSGYNRTLLSRLRPEDNFTALIAFTPYGGVNGEARARIIFDAFNEGLESDQRIGREISATITVVNLQECISIEPATVIMNQTELEKTFKINVGTGSVKCGTAIDFTLDTDLDIDAKTFSIPDGTSKEIKIVRGDPLAGDIIPGQYPVFVRGKFSNQQAKQFLQTVRVRVYEEGCIQLSRYEFDVYDNPAIELDGFDTAVLINECFDKQVPIRIDTRDLLNALKSGSTWGLLTFGVSLIGHGFDPIFGEDGLGGNKNPTNAKDINPAEGTTYNGLQTYYNKSGDNFGKSFGLATNSAGEQIVDDQGNPLYSFTRTDGSKDYWRLDKKIGEDKYVKTVPTTPTGSIILNTLSNPTETLHLPKSSLQRTVELFDTLNESGSTSFSTPTGLQGLFGGGGGSGSGGGLLGNGGIFGAATGLVDGIFGTKNPVFAGLQAFLVATAVDYFTNQDDEERFITTQRDVEIDVIAIENPGEDIKGLERFVAQGVATNLIERKILNNIPDGFRFLAPLVLSKNVNLIARNTDRDIHVEQHVKPSFKALPQGQQGLDPALASVLFGGRADQTIPAISLLNQGARKLERRGLVFYNVLPFETTPDDPKYKVLRVLGIRHFYKDKEYDKDDFEVENEQGWFSFEGNEEIVDPTTGSLEELPAELVDERFRLEFNAIPPETLATEYRPLLNCQDGFRVGSTGAAALPKVKLGWNWNEISSDSCDTGGGEGIYCDATQFSIALLKKINALNDFISTSSPFECPSPINQRSNTSVIPSFDVGISEIALNRVQDDAMITLTIKNTNPQEVSTNYTIQLINAATLGITGTPCTGTVSVLSEEKIQCQFSNLGNANYAAEATIAPTISCPSCEDKVASNFLNINFTVGDDGVAECEPFSTARLEDFMSASGIVGAEATNVLKNVKFQANLIEDRYSSDFQSDFDLYSRTQSFFLAPDYYLDDEGLGTYFKDKDLFNFRPSFGDANPEGYQVDAGRYNVTVDIVFDDSSWELFDEDGTNAKINVVLEKAGEPDDNELSPFLKLPFNGTIGSDGRINYGLNFDGSVVLVNSTTGQGQLKTLKLPNSVPVSTLKVDINEEFKRLNTDARGVILQVIGGNAPSMVYSPSYATPVLLKMSNQNNESWAFYSVEVNNGAQDTGPQMSRWNGVGVNCKAFDDRFMTEYFFTADTHGIDEFRSCARLPGQLERTSYGFEFCEPKQFGDMFLETVFYSPQSSSTILKVNVAQEDAVFLTPSSEGRLVALDHKVLGGEISSVQDIFDLVSNEFVCVSNEEGKTEFWWNPKRLFELIEDQENRAVSECILGVQST